MDRVTSQLKEDGTWEWLQRPVSPPKTLFNRIPPNKTQITPKSKTECLSAATKRHLEGHKTMKGDEARVRGKAIEHIAYLRTKARSSRAPIRAKKGRLWS